MILSLVKMMSSMMMMVNAGGGDGFWVAAITLIIMITTMMLVVLHCWQAESEVKGASKTSEDFLGEGLFGMFGCDSVHFPSNFYEFFVLSDLMALLVMYGFVFCLEKKVESNIILVFQ